ncbi:testis-specific serine/threonine-protein kinase 1-like [Narcine bancroftii]|uniref:testis-specific serine/threonine-protein kinase 1-like n=1 Tax=Narcine bancroftii TaxID=1343680 RepID=UPI0038320AEF
MDDEAALKQRGYTLGVHLGEGSYAKVKCAYSSRLKSKVAVKIIDRKKAPKDFLEKFLPRELEILALLNHRSIVKTFEIFETSAGKIYIIMELGLQGDLLDFMKSRGALPEEVARHMFRQLALAVQYCHDLDVVHRDLKCENVLLGKGFAVKLSDFGFSKRCAAPAADQGRAPLSRTFCGSAAYTAPEILQGHPYQPKSCDVWSLGVILFIMVCGSMPYDDSNIKKMLRLQKEHRVDFPRSRPVARECKELIYRMLHPDIGKRLTIGQVLQHPWLLAAAKQGSEAEPPSEGEQEAPDWGAGEEWREEGAQPESEAQPLPRAERVASPPPGDTQSAPTEGTETDKPAAESATGGRVAEPGTDRKSGRRKSRLAREELPDDSEVYPDQENFMEALSKAELKKGVSKRSKSVEKKGKHSRKSHY